MQRFREIENSRNQEFSIDTLARQCLKDLFVPVKMSSARNSKEVGDLPSDEAFEDVNKYIKDVYDILKREANKVCKEKESFDEMAKKLEHVHFSKMLKLNVGGHFFTTSLETMNKDPGSMLHAMFSGRFDTKPGEDGSYFIDRDGTHFRYILNYLRTGKLLVPEDKLIRNELLAEAEFYQVGGIIEELTTKPLSNDSEILSSDQGETLMNWLRITPGFNAVSVKLLYRASRNGWAASNFHSCCDNKGPTVTVIKSGNYIFGGFTEQNWDGSTGYKRAQNSFLFSLVNPSGLSPTKMSLIPGKEVNAMWCNVGYGSVFGGGSYHDILIRDTPNSNHSSVYLGNAYQCPPGQNVNTFLTGSQNFLISEMEVFGFEKY